jgi:hypothetical protein
VFKSLIANLSGYSDIKKAAVNYQLIELDKYYTINRDTNYGSQQIDKISSQQLHQAVQDLIKK